MGRPCIEPNPVALGSRISSSPCILKAPVAIQSLQISPSSTTFPRERHGKYMKIYRWRRSSSKRIKKVCWYLICTWEHPRNDESQRSLVTTTVLSSRGIAQLLRPRSWHSSLLGHSPKNVLSPPGLSNPGHQRTSSHWHPVHLGARYWDHPPVFRICHGQTSREAFFWRVVDYLDGWNWEKSF